MARFLAQVEDVTIANGGTNSRTVDSALETADAWQINIQAPATLAETCTIQVSHDGTTWVTYNTGAADIAPPAAGKGVIYSNISFPYWRITSATAAAAARTFKVSKLYNAY